jgi:hypothetical protein
LLRNNKFRGLLLTAKTNPEILGGNICVHEEIASLLKQLRSEQQLEAIRQTVLLPAHTALHGTHPPRWSLSLALVTPKAHNAMLAAISSHENVSSPLRGS